MRAFWGLALLLPALAYLALVAYPPARAQSAAHEAVQSAVGTWEISNAEHDKTCSLIFKDDSIAGGFKLEFDQACADKLPRIAGVIAWSMGTHGTLRLLDNEGKAAFAFTEVETGMYEAEEPGAGIFFLQRAATARSAEQTAGQMTGTWLLARNGGETICTLALSAPAAGQDRLRCLDRPARSFFMGDGAQPVGVGSSARRDLAVRGDRAGHLANGPGECGFVAADAAAVMQPALI